MVLSCLSPLIMKKGVYMNNTEQNCYIEIFERPENITPEEWFLLDLGDPLMMVC